MRNELFIIEKGAWMACEGKEIAATYDGLLEMDLARLPYRHCTVRFPAHDLVRFNNVGGLVDYENLEADITIHEYMPLGVKCKAEQIVELQLPSLIIRNRLTGFEVDFTDRLEGKLRDPDGGAGDENLEPYTPINSLVALQHQVRAFLIVMLATRNAVKTTKVDKLARLGIGKKKQKHRYTHVTTISLPKAEDMSNDTEHPPTGKTVCAHLRRGHIRNQHYGPKNSYAKKIWIESVFVNADPTFVSQRQAYNVIR